MPQAVGSAVVQLTMNASILSASDIRSVLAFDVQRLRTAAHRLDAVEGGLMALKRRLEVRATHLSDEARLHVEPEMGGEGAVPLRYAQAQATAELARKAKLGEVLTQVGRLSLIASMAVNRWVSALNRADTTVLPEFVLKGHIDAGRVAHRMLVTLRPRDKLRSGCGQLASSVLVAELVHADNLAFVEEQIVEGLFRGRNARGLRNDDDVLAAASRALRAGAKLLERMADKAEPAAEALAEEAEAIETQVAERLTGQH